MAIADSGHIKYEDDYTQKYEVKWETINGVIDITTITQQPYMWGIAAEAKIENGILYRKGIVTIHRQAIEILTDGYVILAEGTSQFYDFIKMNYLCESPPIDVFKYHLECQVTDDVSPSIVEGSRWADPSDIDDADMIWCDLYADGTPIPLTSTDPSTCLEWIEIF